MAYPKEWDRYDDLDDLERNRLREILKDDLVNKFDQSILDSIIIVTGHGVQPEGDDPAGRLRGQAETYKIGDPSLVGPLADVALGLKTYHMLEIKGLIPIEGWEKLIEVLIEGKRQEKSLSEIWKAELGFQEKKLRKTKNLIFETLKEIRES